MKWFAVCSLPPHQPTVLPYSHLFDVDACAKFVSDFIYYNPDRAYTNTLNSPSRLLNEQIGNSLEMSVLLVSLLRGFGFSAYVAVGWVDSRTARLDQSNMLCPLLAGHVDESKEQERSSEGGIYKLRRPLDLTSKYQQLLTSKAESALSGGGQERRQEAEGKGEGGEVFHGWVYVEAGAVSFFLEPTTGIRWESGGEEDCHTMSKALHWDTSLRQD